MTRLVLVLVLLCCGCLQPGGDHPGPKPSDRVGAQAVQMEAVLLARVCRDLAESPPATAAELQEALASRVADARAVAFKPVGELLQAALGESYSPERARAVLTELAEGFDGVVQH